MADQVYEEELRDRAVARVKEKRDFWGHLVAYVVVNVFLVFVWWMGGAHTSNMWFLWVIGGWGIAVVINAIKVFAFPDAGSRYESEVASEMDRMRNTGGMR